MKSYNVPLIGLLFLAGCTSLEVPSKTETKPITTQPKTWQPSTLSEQTKETAMKASRDYFGCIDQELGKYRYRGGDSRYDTQALLRRCEKRLDPIRDAFASESVPDKITNRYMKRKRTQAARRVLQILQSIEAQHKAARNIE